MKSVKPVHLLVVLLIIFWSVFAFLSLRQHAGFKTQLDDLGNMAQPLWNTLHGRFMEMSNTSGLDFDRMSRFAGHTNFIFLLLVPLYALWPDPQQLLVVQVLLSGLGAIPLFLLGKKLFGRKSWLSLSGPILYLVNPILHDAVLYDMHAIVLALPFLLWSIYFLEIKNYKLFTLSAALLILSKEDMALIVVMLGLWHAWRTYRWKVGGLISLVSAGIFIFTIGLVMPYFRQGLPEVLITRRYDEVGGSIPGMIVTALTHPQVIVGSLMAKGLLSYVGNMMAGFLFLPLLSGLTFAIIPTLLVNLLSNNPINSLPFGYYYPAPIIGILSASTLYGLKHWQKKPLVPEIKFKFLVGSVLVFACLFSYWNSPIPGSAVSAWEEFLPDVRQKELQYIQSLIPSDASLSIQNNLGPHFINRQDIVRFPYRAHTSDYVLVDVTDPYPILRDKPRQRNFVHITQLFPQDFYDFVIEMLEDLHYGVLYTGNGFILFERGADRDLNNAAYYTLHDRSQYYFEPYQYMSNVGPMEYPKPNFID